MVRNLGLAMSKTIGKLFCVDLDLLNDSKDIMDENELINIR